MKSFLLGIAVFAFGLTAAGVAIAGAIYNGPL